MLGVSLCPELRPTIVAPSSYELARAVGGPKLLETAGSWHLCPPTSEQRPTARWRRTAPSRTSESPSAAAAPPTRRGRQFRSLIH